MTDTTRRFVWLLAGTTAMLAMPGPSQEPAAPAAVETTRAALEKWVDTRKAIARTQREWTEVRAQLQDTIELLGTDIAALRAKISAADAGTADIDRKKLDVLAEIERRKIAGRVFADAIAELERRVAALLSRLPTPLRDKVQPLAQRLPATPEAQGQLDESKLSQRYLTVIGILNEVDKWNREITLTSEVRDLGDGTTAEVTVLYVGLARAYYVDKRGQAAGTGSASEDGWTWRALGSSAPAITAAIAMLENNRPAAFVLLPLDVD